MTSLKQRKAIIEIKLKSLVRQTNELRDMMNEEVPDIANAGLRLRDLTALFRGLSDLIEEIAAVTNDEVLEAGDWNEARSAYYQIAAKIQAKEKQDNRRRNSTLPAGTPMGNSTFLEKQKLLKLPVAKLPSFDGNHNDWLSYRNTFISLVDARDDIDNVVKLTYLRSTLTGDAYNKIKRFEISAENYPLAWRALVEAYDRKRILVSKHIDAVLDVKLMTTVLSKELSTLVDNVKQQLNTLQSLGVPVPTRFVVRILERALPPAIRQKWEEALSLDELPNLDKFYTFLQATTARLFTMETDTQQGREKQSGGASKARKGNDGARVLVSTNSQQCVKCNEQHTLYRCPQFHSLTLQARWDFVKSKRLCFNCLRTHTGSCNWSHCRRCDKYHNTMLHDDSNPAPTVNSKTAGGNGNNSSA